MTQVVGEVFVGDVHNTMLNIVCDSARIDRLGMVR